MAANSLTVSQTKSTGGSTTASVAPLAGLAVTITIRTTK